VTAPSFVMEEGAVLNGSVEMTSPVKTSPAMARPPVSDGESQGADED